MSWPAPDQRESRHVTLAPFTVMMMYSHRMGSLHNQRPQTELVKSRVFLDYRSRIYWKFCDDPGVLSTKLSFCVFLTCNQHGVLMKRHCIPTIAAKWSSPHHHIRPISAGPRQCPREHTCAQTWWLCRSSHGKAKSDSQIHHQCRCFRGNVINAAS